MGGITGGGGKSSGGGGSSNQDALSQIAQSFYNESSAARNTILSQGTEALQTGGIGAQIPLINRMQDAYRQALSNARLSTQQNIASQPGVARTPYADSILSGLELTGQQGIQAVGPQMAAQFASMLPGFVEAQGGQATAGLASANQTAAQRYGANTGLFGQLFGSGLQAGGQIGAAFIGA